MENVPFLKVLLVVGVSGALGKYVYYRDRMSWSAAQQYCRRHHTDLAPVSTERDQHRLSDAAAYYRSSGWIGLYRDPNNRTGWKWSGGTYTTYQNWAYGFSSQWSFDCVYTSTLMNVWYTEDCFYFRSVFCFSVTVVTEEKTWEEALEHCRENHTDLVSLLSETELLLTLTEIRGSSHTTTERLWTGLRYLGDRWLWVNRDPVERYQAWSQEGGEHACPGRDDHCGALTTEGRWENRGCGERLHFICY